MPAILLRFSRDKLKLELNHPGIVKHGHHHRAMYHCETELQLDAVWTSITKTVAKEDQELPLLRAASKARRAELRELAAQEKDEKEKAQLITRGSPTDENVRRFSKK
jgi:hypothetical protein